MMRRVVLHWFVVASLACAPVALAQAQAEQDLLVAQREHRAGVDAFARGDYPLAIEHFSAAAKRLPTRAGFSFNLARAYEALGDTSLALAFYRDYVRRKGNPADVEAQKRIATLARQLARRGVQQLSVLSMPEQAEAFIDGAPVGLTPVTRDLAPGPHEIRLRLPGHAPLSERIQLDPDSPLDVAFALKATPGSAELLVSHRTLDPAAASTPPAPARALPVLGVVGLGAGAASLIGALSFELLRARSEQSARSETEQVAFARKLDTLRSQQTLARVFAISGLVLAAVGGGLLYAASDPGRERASDAGLAIDCQPAKCQASLSGVF